MGGGQAAAAMTATAAESSPYTYTICNIKPGVSNADIAADYQLWTASAFLPAVGDRQEEQRLRRYIGGGQASVAAAEASP